MKKKTEQRNSRYRYRLDHEFFMVHHHRPLSIMFCCPSCSTFSHCLSLVSRTSTLSIFFSDALIFCLCHCHFLVFLCLPLSVFIFLSLLIFLCRLLYLSLSLSLPSYDYLCLFFSRLSCLNAICERGVMKSLLVVLLNGSKRK